MVPQNEIPDFGGSSKPSAAELTEDEKLWAMAAPVSVLILVFLSGGLLTFVPPLVIYFIKKEESPFIAHAALQSIYFSIVAVVLSIIGFTLVCCTGGFAAFVVIPLAILLSIAYIGYLVVATIKIGQGKYYTYPLL